jgi:hypothetical protein
MEKTLKVLDIKVGEIMSQEDYNLIECGNGEDYFKFVDKYEIDLTKFLSQS